MRHFAMDPFENPIGHSLVLADAKRKVMERFGAPIQNETRTRQDRTSDAVFTISVLHYAGLKFVIGQAEEAGASWIEKIEITGNEYSLKYGLKIGAPRASVIPALQASNYLESENRLQMTAYVWEERTDVPSRPGEVVRVEGEVDVLVEFNQAAAVTRIVIENVAL